MTELGKQGARPQIEVEFREKHVKMDGMRTTQSIHVTLHNTGPNTLKHYRLEMLIPEWLKPQAQGLQDLGRAFIGELPLKGFALLSSGERSFVYPGQTVHAIGEPRPESDLPAEGPTLHYEFDSSRRLDFRREETMARSHLRWIFYADNLPSQEGQLSVLELAQYSN